MKTLELNSYLAGVKARKAALGLDEGAEAVDARRNKGGRRSASKRALLRKAEKRAKAAKVAPVPSYY
ncbi:hypothetical protein GCM10023208_08210 [Erythrobacter westpacificensis]|uniref:Histone H1 n=1 Tax=Erythrobacter westpacificensis TaxID=1055231 RepID=A0ABP9K627_9SPHN